MDELVRQGAVQIRQRRRQIAALRAELAKLAQRNASEKTVNRAELMGSAWHRLQNAIYMLALLEQAMLRLRKQRASMLARKPCDSPTAPAHTKPASHVAS